MVRPAGCYMISLTKFVTVRERKRVDIYFMPFSGLRESEFKVYRCDGGDWHIIACVAPDKVETVMRVAQLLAQGRDPREIAALIESAEVRVDISAPTFFPVMEVVWT